MKFSFFPPPPPVYASSSNSVVLNERKHALVPSVPHGAKARVTDAKGTVGRVDILKLDGEFMLYAQSTWLKEAALPITYELIPQEDFSFCA